MADPPAPAPRNPRPDPARLIEASARVQAIVESAGAPAPVAGGTLDGAGDDAGLAERLAGVEAELRALRADVARLAGVAPPASPPPIEAAPSRLADAVPPALAPAESTPPAPAPRPADADADAARLVALDLALSGRSRAEAERALAEHYALADGRALVDEVYAAAGL